VTSALLLRANSWRASNLAGLAHHWKRSRELREKSARAAFGGAEHAGEGSGVSLFHTSPRNSCVQHAAAPAAARQLH